MKDQELKNEVIEYYENEDCPFSYTIAGYLHSRKEISLEWRNLSSAYIEGSFTPNDCRFMFSTCPKCGTELKDAPGIGLYCSNQLCDVIDNTKNWDEPKVSFALKKYTSKIDEFEDNLFITIPDTMVLQLGWVAGDEVTWVDNLNGTFTIEKKNKK